LLQIAQIAKFDTLQSLNMSQPVFCSCSNRRSRSQHNISYQQ